MNYLVSGRSSIIFQILLFTGVQKDETLDTALTHQQHFWPVKDSFRTESGNSFHVCLLVLRSSNYTSSVSKTVFHPIRVESGFPHSFLNTMISWQEVIRRLIRACDNMSGRKSVMNRKQASAVNSSEDTCSEELVLVTGASNSSCYHTANSTSVSNKIILSPFRLLYASLKWYCIWIWA